MDTHEEYDDLTDDHDVAIHHRARARAMLNEIARQTKQALAEQGIDIDVFFLIPASGDAIITFGCAGNPSDGEWSRVAEIVSEIVRQSVGLAGSLCRPVTCAATDAITDRRSEMPAMSALALQYAGADDQ